MSLHPYSFVFPISRTDIEPTGIDPKYNNHCLDGIFPAFSGCINKFMQNLKDKIYHNYGICFVLILVSVEM